MDNNNTNPFHAVMIGIFLTMYLFGSIPYYYFANITYANKYQSMMEEAHQRGHIRACPGISDLRWDCNEPIASYSDRPNNVEEE